LGRRLFDFLRASKVNGQKRDWWFPRLGFNLGEQEWFGGNLGQEKHSGFFFPQELSPQGIKWN